MPHLLWQGPTFYNGHLRGPLTFTPVSERLKVKLTLPVFKNQEIEPKFLAREA